MECIRCGEQFADGEQFVPIHEFFTYETHQSAGGGTMGISKHSATAGLHVHCADESVGTVEGEGDPMGLKGTARVLDELLNVNIDLPDGRGIAIATRIEDHKVYGRACWRVPVHGTYRTSIEMPFWTGVPAWIELFEGRVPQPGRVFSKPLPHLDKETA